MNRRTFLRGTVLSAVSGQALVQLANPEEIWMLKEREKIEIARTKTEDEPYTMYMKDKQGYFGIGVINQLDVRNDPHLIDVTSWNDMETSHIRGIDRGTTVNAQIYVKSAEGIKRLMALWS